MKGRGFGFLLLAALTGVGCGDSGQTGSPSCAAPQACACKALAGRTLAQAIVIAVDQGVVRLELQQLLTASATLGPADLQRTLVGELTGPGCSAPISPRVGDGVLAGFFELAHCSEYDQCLGRECQATSGSAFDSCATSCEAECAPDEIPVSVWVEPWADTVEIGEAAPVTRADAIQLTDAMTCDAHYPPPREPCNDVRSEHGSCAVSASGTNHGSALLALSLLALGALCVRRLRLMRATLFGARPDEDEGGA